MSNLLRAQRKDTPRRRADQSAAGEHPTERLTVLLDAETAQALRVFCSTRRMSLSHAVEKAIARYLSDLDAEEIEQETRNLPWVKKEPK